MYQALTIYSLFNTFLLAALPIQEPPAPFVFSGWGGILWGVGLIISAASPIILAMMKRSQDKHNEKSDRTAEAQRLATVQVAQVVQKSNEAQRVAVLEVKDTLLATGNATDKRLAEQGKTLGDVHTLVNSQKGVMLTALSVALAGNAILAREKAMRAEATEADKLQALAAEEAADKAAADLRSHQEQQAIVDARSARPPEGG
jgi:hypothetical protein